MHVPAQFGAVWPGKRLFQKLLAGLAVWGLANAAAASTITFSGLITQSTQDGTGPAVNNPALNAIHDLQSYTVTLVFPGTINMPGIYAGSIMTLSVPLAPASEMLFNSISLTITANAGFDEFSLYACLTTGSGCAGGNQLTANFKILAAGLNSQNVAATGLDPPHPLDLLEDDGTTDIQGTITTYSNTGAASTVPEPSLTVLLGGCLTGLFAASRKQIKKEKNV
jgi:hypothetical protein